MKILVTGVCGFIGSSLAERLLNAGYDVWGVDAMRDNYALQQKQLNLKTLQGHRRFAFVPANILEMPFDALPEVQAVFHLAAETSVRASWQESFSLYSAHNMSATQRLLEYYKDKNLQKFVYASSSSVYGHAGELPSAEDDPLQPQSPYAVSKLAGEQLCSLYHSQFGVPTLILRYFTAFGPRQRPNMFIHMLIRHMLQQGEISLFNGGQHQRDFTYIDDIVAANLLALNSKAAGEIFNIASGQKVSLYSLVERLEALLQCTAQIGLSPYQAGDALTSWGDIRKAQAHLNYTPRSHGDFERQFNQQLMQQVQWQQQLYSACVG